MELLDAHRLEVDGVDNRTANTTYDSKPAIVVGYETLEKLDLQAGELVCAEVDGQEFWAWMGQDFDDPTPLRHCRITPKMAVAVGDTPPHLDVRAAETPAATTVGYLLDDSPLYFGSMASLRAPPHEGSPPAPLREAITSHRGPIHLGQEFRIEQERGSYLEIWHGRVVDIEPGAVGEATDQTNFVPRSGFPPGWELG